MEELTVEEKRALHLLREGVGPEGEIPLAVVVCRNPRCRRLHMMPLSVDRLRELGLEGKKAGFCKTAEKNNGGDVARKVRVAVEGFTFCLAHPTVLLQWPLRLPLAVD